MKNIPLGLLLITALAGAVGGYLSYRHFVATPPKLVPAAASPPQPMAGTADLPSEAPAEPSAPPVPEQVPDVRLPDLAGKLHALQGTPGHARLFNFWATWCEPCRREIPLLNALQAEYSPEELQVVGVAVDFRDAVRKFIRATPLHYTSLIGEDNGLEVAQKFGVELALPFSVFADEHNQIIAVKVGELHREEADAILAHMRALRAGTETLEAARVAISASLQTLAAERSKQSIKN